MMSAGPFIETARAGLTDGRQSRVAWPIPGGALTGALCVLVGAVFLSPSVTALLQLDREAVIAGQWWRVVTFHLAHWNGQNLFWNLAAFAVLGWWCESISRMRFAVTVVASAVLVSAAAWFLSSSSGLTVCRGLSGIDSALFGLLGVMLLRAHRAEGNRLGQALVGLTLMAFLAKITLELITGRAVFVDSATAGFAPMPLAHLVGAVTGAIMATLPQSRDSLPRARAGEGTGRGP